MAMAFEFADKILEWAIQVKATERYFPVLLFIMLHKMNFSDKVCG